MTTSAISPQPTLYDVLNAMLGAVGGWVVSCLLRRDVGQVFGQRIEAVCELWVRFEAGTLRRRGPSKVVAAPVAADVVADDVVVDVVARPKPVRLLPHKFGWLLTHMEYRAAPFHGQLTELLQQPRLAEFLEAFPHVARKLRPICRAFAVDTALLRLPRKIRVPRERKPRVRKPSYVEYEYKPRDHGPHFVMRISKRAGLRLVKVKY